MNVRSGQKEHLSETRSTADLSLLERTAVYANLLELPEPEGAVYAETASMGEGNGSCLLFGTDGTSAGGMNAGYLAGQSVSYLRFFGIETEIVRVMPEGVAGLPAGMQFAAALLVRDRVQERFSGQKKSAEPYGCIYTESRENWSDELLTFAKKQYPGTFQRIRASRKENWIHFVMKRSGRYHGFEDSFEAGMAAANIMTAAEELWVELEMVRLREEGAADGWQEDEMPEGYLFSVCRKGDRQINYA